MDSNHRRHSRQIYSLLPLAARATLRKRCLIPLENPLPGALVYVEDFSVRTSWRGDLNPEPPVYKTGALPLSYASPSLGTPDTFAARRVNDALRPRKQNWRHRGDTSALASGRR